MIQKFKKNYKRTNNQQNFLFILFKIKFDCSSQRKGRDRKRKKRRKIGIDIKKIN